MIPITDVRLLDSSQFEKFAGPEANLPLHSSQIDKINIRTSNVGNLSSGHCQGIRLSGLWTNSPVFVVVVLLRPRDSLYLVMLATTEDHTRLSRAQSQHYPEVVRLPWAAAQLAASWHDIVTSHLNWSPAKYYNIHNSHTPKISTNYCLLILIFIMIIMSV